MSVKNIEFNSPVYFITGIDTDVGKTYATAMLATYIAEQGQSVVTQKFIQTGCSKGVVAEDIVAHRKLQGIELLPEDKNYTTCPLIYRLPSSPHLAAREEGEVIDVRIIERSTSALSSKYDVVLIEGAGGILVPITERYTTADYIMEHKIPIIIVSTAQLGSLNHTMLSLEYCRSVGVDLVGIVYNRHICTNDIITNDTANYIKKYLAKYYNKAWFYEMDTVISD